MHTGVMGIALNLQNLNPRDRGRITSHLAKHVRYEGRTMTNEELYIQHGQRVEHDSRNGYKLIVDTIEGTWVPIPKMIHDATRRS